jgi:hypothetical protein
MLQKAKEHLLNELIEHPVLGVQLATGGIERRCLDLLLDFPSGRHRFAGAEYEDAHQFRIEERSTPPKSVYHSWA